MENPFDQFDKKSENPFDQFDTSVNNIPELKQDLPSWKYTVSEWSRPVLEGIGLVAGGLAGSAVGPLGAVGGAAALYTAGSEASDRLDEFLGIRQAPTISEQTLRIGGKMLEGAKYEMGGQIFGKALSYTAGKISELFKGRRFGLTPSSATLKAGEKLQESTTPGEKYLSNLDKAYELEKEIGNDLRFTRGQATGDPNVIAAERARIRGKGETGAVAIDQFQTGQKAIREYAAKKVGTGREENFVSALGLEQKRLASAAKAAQEDVNILSARATTGKSDIAVGETIRGTVNANKARARLEAGKLYDAIPDVNLNAKPLVEEIKSLRKGFDKDIEISDNFPSHIINGTQKKISKNGEIAFKDLRKIRETAKAELRKANSGINPNSQLAGRLNSFIESTEAILDSTGELPGDAGVAYRSASKFYRENYVEPFKQGSIKNSLTKDATGAYTVRNANIAEKFFQKGELGIEVADDFYRGVGDDKLAQSAMQDYVRHKLLFEVTDEQGNVITQKLGSFIKNYEPALKKYNLYREVNTLQKAQNLVDSAIETESLFTRSSAGRALGASPDNIVSEIFKGKDAVNAATTTRKILSIIKDDPAAVSGFETALKNHIFRAAEMNNVQFGDFPNLSNAALKKQLKRFEPVLRELYKDNPEKIKAWMNIRNTLETLYRNQASPIGGGSDTMENLLHTASEVTGPIVTKRYAMVNAIRTAGKILSRYGDETVNALMNRAVFDPDFAYSLMYIANGKATEKEISRMISKYVTELSVYATISSGKEKTMLEQ